jgi:hypothetical protein
VTSRYRRSSVRAVVEHATQDHTITAHLHDALWAVLWNRRYDDVDEPVWQADSAYSGVLAFVHALDPQAVLAGVDTGESFVAFRVQGAVPPTGSRVRVVPGAREMWRLGDVQALGIGVELHFDSPTAVTEHAWVDTLRAGVSRLREIFDARREGLAARRTQLGALQEPSSLEEIWREEVAGISDRIALETEFTPKEHAVLARARSKGARSADEEERRIVGARKKRFSDRAAAEVAAFREERWPAIRDKSIAETRRYADYRTEVVRLEDALQRIRALTDRAAKAIGMLDALEKAGFRVAALAFEPERLEEAVYAEELLRTIELLHAAIPLRAAAAATSFSAYRAPTAGPSVIPPRF